MEPFDFNEEMQSLLRHISQVRELLAEGKIVLADRYLDGLYTRLDRCRQIELELKYPIPIAAPAPPR